MGNDKMIHATGVSESLRTISEHIKKRGLPHIREITEFPKSFDLFFITEIEEKLGWELGVVGIERAMQLKELGATVDQVVEALTLL